MSFVETIRRARDLLRAEGRISVGVLRREFDLDEDALDELVEELVDVQQVAAREGKVLSWIGATPAEAPATEPETQSTPEASSEPAAAPQAAEAERHQLTVMFCDLVGSTKPSEALDAEDLRAVLPSSPEFCAEVVRRADGQTAQDFTLVESAGVLYGDDRLDSRDGPGCSGIETANAGVGVGAAQYLAGQHAGQDNVSGV